ncbi:WD40/YVTN/BNR-like repeat-containing protein [Pseudidiomarina gelatinasegens]|uniref:WD40/YVTN/BNR-like repeat-containing protein n=1 Tax=Pseudidiomarina gelatinasegens TaxID=2487740 RepID=UPI003A984B5A
MAKGMRKLFSLLAGFAPWLIVAGLAYAAAFIKPETELRPLPQPLLESRDVFFDVVATTDNTLVYVGSKGTLLTRDVDFVWQRGQFAEQLNLQSIAVNTSGVLAAVGNQGALYVYDGEPNASAIADPRNWRFQALPVNEFASKLLSITASSDGFWVVGEMGTIFHLQQHTTGEPLSIVTKQLDHDINLSDVVVADNGTIWIAGEFGTLLHSSNNGKTWQTQEITDVTLQSIALANGKMLVVGNSGFIATSNDDGASWKQLASHTNEHLYSATAIDQGWVVGGANGTLLWRTANTDWQTVASDEVNFNFISSSSQLSRQEIIFTGSHLTQLSFSTNPLQLKAVTPRAKEGEL